MLFRSSGIPKTLRSLAAENDRDAFFVTSGQVRTQVDVKESGKTTYAILVTGVGPETAPDPERAGFITFDVNVQPGTVAPSNPPADNTPKCTSDQVLKDGKCVPKDKPTPPRTDNYVIPSWIKSNAKFWATDKITDKDFVSGIQYLINQKIIKVPAGAATGEKSDTIPAWVKNSAGFWAEGKTTDKDFVGGLQYLISNGIIKLKS